MCGIALTLVVVRGTSRLSQLSQVALGPAIQVGGAFGYGGCGIPFAMLISPNKQFTQHSSTLHSMTLLSSPWNSLVCWDRIIVRWRRLIIEEVSELKDELEEATIAWLESLLPHGKIAYKAGACTNVPLLLHIGVLFHYQRP